MITLHRNGTYKLIETKKNTKILYLDNDTFAWVEPATIGEILVVSHKVHKTDCVLSIGDYRLYDVDNEPMLSDQMHLELEVGKDCWQGYLLLTGLPNQHKLRSRIIPTQEVITNNSLDCPKKRVTKLSRAEAQSIGQEIGVDFSEVDLDQFRLGIMVELEHGSHDPETNVTDDDLPTTGKIAWAHLKELPDYYHRLAKIESESEN